MEFPDNDNIISVKKRPVQSILTLPTPRGVIGSFIKSSSQCTFLVPTKSMKLNEESEESVFLTWKRENSKKIKDEDEFRRIFIECLNKVKVEDATKMPRIKRWLFGEPDGKLTIQDQEFMEKCIDAALLKSNEQEKEKSRI